MKQPPAKLLAHSVNAVTGQEIISFELFMWKPVVGELARHRMLSLSVGSSRAVPLAAMRQNIHNQPFLPEAWGANRGGMQSTEVLDEQAGLLCEKTWKQAMEAALQAHMLLETYGLHKQYANRLIEPFMYVPVLVTATDTANLYRLRCHKDAQPEIRENIEAARELHHTSEPEVLQPGQWHTVYLSPEEKAELRKAEEYLSMRERLVFLLRCSAARAARVSYFWHDGSPCDVVKEQGIAKKLMGSQPFHASPFEHQAVATELQNYFYNPAEGKPLKSWEVLRAKQQGNFRGGWLQHRGLVETDVEPYCTFAEEPQEALV
jgi:hypothetical protein